MRLKILALILLAGLWVVGQWPDDRLRIVFCDVGQGDAELIIKGSVQILIDGGPSDQGVLRCLGNNVPFWDHTLEMVVSTHADKDHIGGIDNVASRFKINLLLVSEPGSNQDSKFLVEEIAKQKIKVHTPKAGERLKVAGMDFEILWPEETDEVNLLAWQGQSKVLGTNDKKNEKSIVMRLSFGAFTAMFTGDISEKEELAMLEAGVITPVTILKVPHHGSKYSSSQAFIEATKPKLVVVEVGENNSYGHPSSIITKRYDAVGARLFRTDINGETVVVTDGKKWWVE